MKFILGLIFNVFAAVYATVGLLLLDPTVHPIINRVAILLLSAAALVGGFGFTILKEALVSLMNRETND